VTADQISALITPFGAIIGIALLGVYRWTSTTGRILRQYRHALELAEETINATRRVARQAGVAVADLPPIPRALTSIDTWSGFDP